MEIKNCEQYVVTKLVDSEKEIESLQDQLKLVNEHLHDVRELYEGIRSLFASLVSYKTTEEGFNYITFESVWERYDTEEYNAIKKFLSED